MAVIRFTSHLQSHTACPPVEVAAGTVRDALEAALAGNERLRSYLLDDQNYLRRHIMVFVDGHMIADRIGLSDPVSAESEVYVMQALSGG